jgi:hypothetical protein
MENTLVVIRGLPGSGKSTLAKCFTEVGFVHAEADMFFQRGIHYNFDQLKLADAHTYCEQFVEAALHLNRDVVVANTFVLPVSLDIYKRKAQEAGAEFKVFRCIGDYGSVHDVPPAVLRDMAANFKDYPGELLWRPPFPYKFPKKR